MPKESIKMKSAVVNPETACGRNPSSGINILGILVIALLLIFNGIFAMYEIALVSARRSSLEDEAKSGRLGAATALELLREPEKVLSAIQVGITLIGIVSGAYGGLTLAGDVAVLFKNVSFLALYAQALSIVIVVGVITYLSLIIGELVPKTIALNNAEAIAIVLSPAMKLFSSAAYPIVWILSVSTKLVLQFFGVENRRETPVTEEELRMVIQKGSEHGVIEKEESGIGRCVWKTSCLSRSIFRSRRRRSRCWSCSAKRKGISGLSSTNTGPWKESSRCMISRKISWVIYRPWVTLISRRSFSGKTGLI